MKRCGVCSLFSLSDWEGARLILAGSLGVIGAESPGSAGDGRAAGQDRQRASFAALLGRI